MFSLYIKLTISWIYYEELKVFSCTNLYQIWTKSYLYWYRCWEDCVLFNVTLKIFHWYSAFACEGLLYLDLRSAPIFKQDGILIMLCLLWRGPFVLLYYIRRTTSFNCLFRHTRFQRTSPNSDHHEKTILV